MFSKNEIIRELRFKIRSSRIGTAEILKGILISLEVKEREVVESVQGRHLFLSVYPKSRFQMRQLIRRLRKLNLKGVIFEARSLKKKDWQDLWKEDFKPFFFGKSFVVIPLWLKKKYVPNKRIPIYIDTSLAFGTGLHETTRFMVRLMEHCRGRLESFLDVGTGTGILSIAALKCGVKTVRAVDFSPDCVRVAKSNFRENGCKVTGLKTADIHADRIKGRYDFVAANLVTHNLIKAGKRLVSLVKPGKYLAVSGVSIENYKYFRGAFKRYPLRCLKIIKGKSWAAVLFQRR